MTSEYHVTMEIQGDHFYLTQDNIYITRRFLDRGIWRTHDGAELAELAFWLLAEATLQPSAPESPGFGNMVRVAGQRIYLTADGRTTRDRRCRGHWPTKAEAESAMRSFLMARLSPQQALCIHCNSTKNEEP